MAAVIFSVLLILAGLDMWLVGPVSRRVWLARAERECRARIQERYLFDAYREQER